MPCAAGPATLYISGELSPLPPIMCALMPSLPACWMIFVASGNSAPIGDHVGVLGLDARERGLEVGVLDVERLGVDDVDAGGLELAREDVAVGLGERVVVAVDDRGGLVAATCRGCALTVVGITCDSASESRKTVGPIAVTPSAVVDVPITGKLALAAIGNALNASPESVGPSTIGVEPSVVNFCIRLTTCAPSVAASCTSNVRFAPPASILPDLMSSLASSYAFFCGVP